MMRRESMDVVLSNMRKESTMELAAMLKEAKSGTMLQLDIILAKFCLQEGRTWRKAKEYFKNLQLAQLVTFKKGGKTWKYNSSAEWELFKINI